MKYPENNPPQNAPLLATSNVGIIYSNIVLLLLGVRVSGILHGRLYRLIGGSLVLGILSIRVMLQGVNASPTISNVWYISALLHTIIIVWRCIPYTLHGTPNAETLQGVIVVLVSLSVAKHPNRAPPPPHCIRWETRTSGSAVTEGALENVNDRRQALRQRRHEL